VLLRGLENAQAYVAGGRLCVAEQVSRPGTEVLSELMRVDPFTGRVRAARRLGSAFDQALLSLGVLWATTTRGQMSWLWRLDPGSLAVRSKKLLPGSGLGPSGGIVGTIALAGGWVWVGSWDRLDRVSLGSGHVTAAVPVRDAHGIDVAADAAGRVLIDSEGQQLARVQRRDLATGGLIAQSPVYRGVSKPSIGGVFDCGAVIRGCGWAPAKLVGFRVPTAANGAAGDLLGLAVAMRGNTIVAGAPNHTVTGNLKQGAAKTFASAGPAQRNEINIVTDPAGATAALFGFSVAIQGGTIVVGAAGETSASVFFMPAPPPPPPPPPGVAPLPHARDRVALDLACRQ
jgi:hypothetical protein